MKTFILKIHDPVRNTSSIVGSGTKPTIYASSYAAKKAAKAVLETYHRKGLMRVIASILPYNNTPNHKI